VVFARRAVHAIFRIIWMRNAANDQAVWTLRGNVADLSCGILSGRIDASRPNSGLHDVALDGARRSASLLSVYRSDITNEKSWPLPLAESYVRGNDLVASYQATDSWPFSPQLYWRSNSLRAVDGVLASASLLVSVQTHLLDTVPQIAVASHVPWDEVLSVSVSGAKAAAVQIDSSQMKSAASEDCCVLMRSKDVPLSYLEMMPAGDFHAAALLPQGNEKAFEWRLFAEFLEKGVIRRARVHVAIVPRDNDVEIAAACCKAIDRLELPLTT
jgi:hypothetical protein